jgi:hypothetical protein
MESLAISKRLYRCELFTDVFKIQGKLEPMGEIITALGDERRGCMPVHESIVTPVSAYNPLGTIAIPELMVKKSNLMFVTLLDKSDYEDIRLQPNVTVLTVYTSTFAIQAEFHLGGEIRVRDFIDTMISNFIAITDAKLFPLIPSKTELTVRRPFLLLNKNFITMYHGEDME